MFHDDPEVTCRRMGLFLEGILGEGGKCEEISFGTGQEIINSLESLLTSFLGINLFSGGRCHSGQICCSFETVSRHSRTSGERSHQWKYWRHCCCTYGENIHHNRNLRHDLFLANIIKFHVTESHCEGSSWHNEVDLQWLTERKVK